jgi:uncharacterized protein YjiS (DUF1127 family)
MINGLSHTVPMTRRRAPFRNFAKFSGWLGRLSHRRGNPADAADLDDRHLRDVGLTRDESGEKHLQRFHPVFWPY